METQDVRDTVEVFDILRLHVSDVVVSSVYERETVIGLVFQPVVF